jgi:hypothetical protein
MRLPVRISKRTQWVGKNYGTIQVCIEGTKYKRGRNMVLKFRRKLSLSIRKSEKYRRLEGEMRSFLKRIVVKIVDERVNCGEIVKLAMGVVNHAEVLYALS